MFRSRFVETSPFVYHAREWGLTLNREDVDTLVEMATANPKGRARLCMHPTPEETEQQMLIALKKAVPDEIHKHSHKREAMVPVEGTAHLTYFDDNGGVLSRLCLNPGGLIYCSTPLGVYHRLELESDVFVFWEFSLGPFRSDSTQRLA